MFESSTSEEGLLAYNLACGIECAIVVFCVGAAFLSLETFELPYLLILIGLQLPSAALEKVTESSAPENPELDNVAEVFA